MAAAPGHACAGYAAMRWERESAPAQSVASAGRCPPAVKRGRSLYLRPRIDLKEAAVYRRDLRVSTTAIPSKSKPTSANSG